MSKPKQLLLEQFALVGRALGQGHRLELLDVLVQGERSVESLARACELSVGNASQHLKRLQQAGLVASRRQGRRVIYRLADPAVMDLVRQLWRVAERNLAEIERVIERFYRQRDALEPVSRDELLARIRDDSVLVLDVRPAEEHGAAHLPSAISIPVDELERRLHELPSDRDIVACCRGPYCVYAYEAVEILRARGFSARRLDGGFVEWLAADLPVERPKRAPAAEHEAAGAGEPR